MSEPAPITLPEALALADLVTPVPAQAHEALLLMRAEIQRLHAAGAIARNKLLRIQLDSCNCKSLLAKPETHAFDCKYRLATEAERVLGESAPIDGVQVRQLVAWVHERAAYLGCTPDELAEGIYSSIRASTSPVEGHA